MDKEKKRKRNLVLNGIAIPIDPCYFTDFFDCNILKILFCQKCQKGFVHSGCGSKISAFRSIQSFSPSFVLLFTSR